MESSKVISSTVSVFYSIAFALYKNNQEAEKADKNA